MKLSISETAKLLGISVRTLHYYDEIGLLAPSEVTAAGYRVYDDAALARLQQILFFRELEFPLKDIADMLSRPDYDKAPALAKRRALLLLQRQHIDTLLALVDETMGGTTMQTKKTTAADIEAAKTAYAAEAAERWGKTDAYRESQARHAAYTANDQAAIAEDADAIFAAFAAALRQEKSPASPEVQALVKRWQDHITKYHYTCSKEILAGLGQMYVGDARFTETLDRFGDGNARFLSEAIACYCAQG